MKNRFLNNSYSVDLLYFRCRYGLHWNLHQTKQVDSEDHHAAVNSDLMQETVAQRLCKKEEKLENDQQ